MINIRGCIQLDKLEKFIIMFTDKNNNKYFLCKDMNNDLVFVLIEKLSSEELHRLFESENCYKFDNKYDAYIFLCRNLSKINIENRIQGSIGYVQFRQKLNGTFL